MRARFLSTGISNCMSHMRFIYLYYTEVWETDPYLSIELMFVALMKAVSNYRTDYRYPIVYFTILASS